MLLFSQHTYSFGNSSVTEETAFSKSCFPGNDLWDWHGRSHQNWHIQPCASPSSLLTQRKISLAFIVYVGAWRHHHFHYQYTREIKHQASHKQGCDSSSFSDSFFGTGSGTSFSGTLYLCLHSAQANIPHNQQETWGVGKGRRTIYIVFGSYFRDWTTIMPCSDSFG